MDALGRWGVRWIPELGDEDLDPHLLLWDMHRNVDLCDFDPGYPEYASVEGDLRTLTMVWRGDLSWPEALRSGRLEVDGQPRRPATSPGGSARARSPPSHAWRVRRRRFAPR